MLWQDPGRVEALDFAAGPGGPEGAPQPPFRFQREDLGGSSPKIFVQDAKGRTWNVKFGMEVKAETFASRVPWAAGYYIEPMYLIREGRVENVGPLSKRAVNSVKPDGTFTEGRFQLRDPDVRFMKDRNWSWTFNPFVGTHELNGLKIVLMLVSNWDNKDARDAEEGMNTGVFQLKDGIWMYAFTDWGGSMGSWGNYFHRSDWKCEPFARQTPDFIRGVRQGEIQFGYRGRHNPSFLKGITVEDARWVLQYIGRITDDQLRAGLRASGATDDEVQCFTTSLRKRIQMLQNVVRAGK